MRRRLIQVLLIVAVGVVLGVAIGGFPKRVADSGSQVVASETTTTLAPTTSSSTAPTTAPAPPPPAARSPKAVTVLVANASTVQGSAKRISVKLAALGYHALDPDANQPNRATAAIYYRGGFSAEAMALADALGADHGQVQPMPSRPPSTRAASTDVYVVVGQDLAVRK